MRTVFRRERAVKIAIVVVFILALHQKIVMFSVRGPTVRFGKMRWAQRSAYADGAKAKPGADIPNCIYANELEALRAKYELPETFMADLNRACLRAPLGDSGMRHIMFTISSTGHLYLALNLLCSSLAAGVSNNFHIFMMADAVSFAAIRAINRNAVFLDVSAKVSWKFFCKLKLFIQYRLIEMGVESTVCDDDVIFVSNPCRLFKSDCDIEVSTESIVYGAEDHNFAFNIGFMHVVPSAVVARIYALWIKRTVKQVVNLDQVMLLRMIGRLRIRPPKPQLEQSYDVTRLIGSRAILTVRFFHPLDVSHAGLLYFKRNVTEIVAREKGYLAPVVVHLSWLGQDKKFAVLENLSLNFVIDGRCGDPPSGLAFDNWKKNNRVHS